MKMQSARVNNWEMNASEKKASPMLAKYTGEYMVRVYLQGRIHYSTYLPHRREARRARRWRWDDRLHLY
jgi:hypothetical protein